MAFRISIGPKEDYKLVVLVRNDVKMGKGKVAAQVGHAAVECALYAEKKDRKSFDAWYNSGQAKIVLKVDSMEQLTEYMKIARGNGLHTAVITDAGRTQIEPGTVTCMGIGPAPVSEIDKVTGDLKML
ncbi:MAG: peptidyl-tRNA hydrolase [Candidatus Methanomethylophilaceae archaeon]|nr:peptidyl-tRNA hydrolase [Candidatus Methanomethylophilaceae archaeon]